MQKLIILIVFLLTVSIGLSQTIDTTHSNDLDLVKTIKQNEVMREEILSLRKQVSEQDSIMKIDSLIREQHLTIIRAFETENKLQGTQLDLLKTEYQLEKLLIINKYKNKKFGLGVSTGIAITSEGNFKPYVGLGLTYNFISF